VPDLETNSLIFVTSDENFKAINTLLNKLDIRPLQVLIEAMIIEVSLEDETDFGIDWNKLPGKIQLQHSTGSGFTYDVISSISDIKNFIDVLKKNYKFNVISTPKINTSNNKSAVITVAEEVPYLTGKYEKSGSEGTQYTYQYRDVGITLEVTPHINQNNDLTLEIRQTIKSVLDKQLYEAPYISKREAQTTVVLKNKQPLIIGGIMQKNTSRVKSKVPGLGDLPLLGKLFSRDNLVSTKTELLIFITPIIIENDEEAKTILDTEKNKIIGN